MIPSQQRRALSTLNNAAVYVRHFMPLSDEERWVQSEAFAILLNAAAQIVAQHLGESIED